MFKDSFNFAIGDTFNYLIRKRTILGRIIFAPIYLLTIPFSLLCFIIGITVDIGFFIEENTRKRQ